MEYQGQSYETPLQKSSKNYRPIHEIYLKGTLLPERTSVPTRATKFCQLHHPQRATSLPPSSKIFNQVQVTQTTAEANNNSSGVIETNVVAISHVLFHSSTQAPHNQLPHDRRSRCRLGSSTRQSPLFRSMDRDSEELAFQQKRNVCCLRRYSKDVLPSSECSHLTTNGQSHYRSLHPEGGRHKGSLQLLNLTYLLLHIFDRNITLSAVYLPGRYNGSMD